MLCTILPLDMEAIMNNKHPGIFYIGTEEDLDVLDPKEYGICKAKAADIQYLNTHLVYEVTRKKRPPATSTISELISNYDLVLHSIASLSLQKVYKQGTDSMKFHNPPEHDTLGQNRFMGLQVHLRQRHMCGPPPLPCTRTRKWVCPSYMIPRKYPNPQLH